MLNQSCLSKINPNHSILLNPIFQYYVKNYCIYIHEGRLSVVFFFSIMSFDLDNAALKNELGSVPSFKSSNDPLPGPGVFFVRRF